MNEEITVEWCEDLEYLDPIFKEPEYLDPTLDDSMPRELLATIAPAIKAGCKFGKLMVDGKGVGFFMLVPPRAWCETEFDVHVCLTRECRGARAMRVGRAGLAWVWAHTKARRLTCVCRDWLPQTRVFARGCGFQRDFYEADCFQRKGQKHGCWHMEIYRPIGVVSDVVEGGPSWLQQQQLSVRSEPSARSPIPRVRHQTNPILLTTAN